MVPLAHSNMIVSCKKDMQFPWPELGVLELFVFLRRVFLFLGIFRFLDLSVITACPCCFVAFLFGVVV